MIAINFVVPFLNYYQRLLSADHLDTGTLDVDLVSVDDLQLGCVTK